MIGFANWMGALGGREAWGAWETWGNLGAFLALGAMAVLSTIVVYIYTSIALMTIGKKLKHKYPWMAWIPVANIALIPQLGSFHWAWVFLLLVPFLGWTA